MLLKPLLVHLALLVSCSLALPLSKDEGTSTPPTNPSNSNTSTLLPGIIELDTTPATTTESPAISDPPINEAEDDSLFTTTTTSSPTLNSDDISSTTSTSGIPYISISSQDRTAAKAVSQNAPGKGKDSQEEDEDDDDKDSSEEDEEDDDDEEEKFEKLKAPVLFVNGNAAPWISDDIPAIKI